MGLYPIEQVILQRWKSVTQIRAFLRREFDRINHRCFRGALPKATLQIRRTWLPQEPAIACRLLAHYKAPKGRSKAIISLYPQSLVSQEQARAALVHEMIHHWETSTGHDCSHAKRFHDRAKAIARQLNFEVGRIVGEAITAKRCPAADRSVL